jgi:hypothetical protein
VRRVAVALILLLAGCQAAPAPEPGPAARVGAPQTTPDLDQEAAHLALLALIDERPHGHPLLTRPWLVAREAVLDYYGVLYLGRKWRCDLDRRHFSFQGPDHPNVCLYMMSGTFRWDAEAGTWRALVEHESWWMHKRR